MKNKFMKAATLLMALTLMTSCFVGGTFAKYTTSDSASDTARVAKWGVTALVTGSLFGENYDETGAHETADKIVASVEGSVDVDANGGNIVAPGTKSDKGLALVIKGTPEVKYDVTYTESAVNKDIFLAENTYGRMVQTAKVTADNYVGYYYYDKVNESYMQAESSDDFAAVGVNGWFELHDAVIVASDYYPVEWTVATESATGTANCIINYNYRTTADMSAALQKAINDETAGDYDKVDGKAKDPIDLRYVISWAWAFEGQNDQADTILGNLMADTSTDGYEVVKLDTDKYVALVENTDYCLNIGFGATIAVEQVN